MRTSPQPVITSKFLSKKGHAIISLCLVFSPIGTEAQARKTTVTVQAVQPGKAISLNLVGVFFEDLNYAADGTDKRRNTLRTAIAEAAGLTGFERNGDVVSLASCAPLLARLPAPRSQLPAFNFSGTEVFLRKLSDRVSLDESGSSRPPHWKNAPTPPMGWNSWDCFGTTLTEAQAKA